jgi:methylated-DNA-protein-cysteine methyltransferase related protein
MFWTFRNNRNSRIKQPCYNRFVQSTKTFRERVLDVIANIPEGRVMTYGQLAEVAGMPRHARVVGDILHGLSLETDLPWWRVINSSGKISTYKVGTGELQKGLLEREAVQFDTNGKLKLEKYRWQIEVIDTED